MKKLLLLFIPLFFVLSAIRSQTITQTPGVPHTTGTPTGAPSPLTKASWLRFDKTNKILYRWTGSAWTATLPGVLAPGSVTNTELASGTGGIYKGSGTVPASTVATATNGFRMNSGASGQILLGDYGVAGLGSSLNLQGSGVVLGTSAYGFRSQVDDQYTQMVSPGYTVRLEPTTGYTLIQSGATNGYKFWDLRATPRGVEYSGDYSATYNDRSLVDFGSVKGLISDSLAASGTPTLQDVALAGNETTLPIIASTVNVKNDNEFTGVIEAGELTVDRTFSLPNIGGLLLVSATETVTLNFPSTAAGASSDLTITVTGAVDGNPVSLGVPNASTLSNGIFTAWVSAADTVKVRFTNNSSGALDPASGAFRATVLKY